MIPLDTRSRNILLFLLNSNEPVSAKTIAALLNFTPREVGYSMKHLEFWLAEKEIELSKKPGSGYFINILLEEKERLITRIKGITSYHLILSHVERVQLLVFALFTETPPPTRIPLHIPGRRKHGEYT